MCQHLIRNCDKTRLRKKAGITEDKEGEEGEEAAKEWTQARNLDEEVERGGEKDGEVEREEEQAGEEAGEEEGDGEVEREKPKVEEDP